MSEWDIVLRLFILQSILTSQYHVSHSGALLQILWKNKESQEYKKKKKIKNQKWRKLKIIKQFFSNQINLQLEKRDF